MSAIRRRSRELMDSLWVADPGFTMPNAQVYPWQWLWDSCFHAIIWADLGDRRAITELETLFSNQLPNGMVPHMGYHGDPAAALPMWGVSGHSTITQPPMWGHALAVMADHGVAAAHLHEPARRGLMYLLDSRRDAASGLITVVHPWETGCDNNHRWDAFQPGPFDRARWDGIKQALVGSLEIHDGGGRHNPDFEVGSVGFSALVAFNCRELARVTGDLRLTRRADELVRSIEARWRPELRTWADAVVHGPATSATANTLDALLPLLVVRDPDQRRAAIANLTDRHTLWRPFGPAGAAVGSPGYDPDQYWRGPSWPQLTYLLMIATERPGEHVVAHRLAQQLVAGAMRSGMAEFWNPESGAGRGARPQAWTALAAVADRRIRTPERIVALLGRAVHRAVEPRSRGIELG